MATPVLDIRDLSVDYQTDRGVLHALRHINLQIEAGRIVGIVGESGCGKSTLISTIIRLLAPNATIAAGAVHFKGRNLLDLDPDGMRALRGNEISMVFQDPMTSLNPVLSIGRQMTDIQYRDASSKAEKRARAIRLLERVGIPDPAEQLRRYPHHLSGGMRQRVAIAMALMTQPALLIADEPTTALDVTVQAQILELLSEIRREFGTAIILITHDLGVVAGSSDRALVMYGGQLMEYGNLEQIFHHSRHPYTQGLLRSVPRLDQPGLSRLQTIPGNPPSLMALPVGCPFEPRCEFRESRCKEQRPALEAVGDKNFKACHRSSLA